MRGEHREGEAALGGFLGGGRLRLVGIDEPGAMEQRDDAVAGGGGGFREAVRPACFRGLRQGDEQRALGRREMLRLLAEIGERGGARALDIAAIGRERQIEIEDLRLAQAALDLQCTDHLGELVAEAAFGARLEEAGDLHGERRAAGHDVAVGRCLPRGAEQRLRVDAAMLVEALVLIGDEHGEEARVDVLARHRQAPVAVTR